MNCRVPLDKSEASVKDKPVPWRSTGGGPTHNRKVRDVRVTRLTEATEGFFGREMK